ncbi:Major facilitator superfamily domain-containing protein 12 [Sesamum angolense]|uniref:Major facilitator superfamily domain-containing protein 12 n=1 Tax=Sesamum angolense TaxID=2727404 RepID=A0AAE1XFK6_9LAMI|nr:Major facilitator superfamily domain-containing protein 12 [Sesamum angolense]
MAGGTGNDESCTKPLGRCSVFYYGVGHMLNDITSACWFTYLLVFLTDIGLPPSDAAVVMLSGQIADGFTTVFAGELIDRYGHFKIWHGAGSLLVAVSFSSVFGGCLPCKIIGSNSSSTQTIGYSFFAAIFNVGWAATQVSHMSMVNCITLNSTSRVVLASCRNAFTMAFLAFYVINDLQMTQSSKALVPAVIYICSFIISILLQEVTWTGQRLKAFYSAGGLLWIISGAAILFLPSSMKAFMYILSIAIGIANALMMVSGVSMQSFLVGNDLNGCAFVYGSLSFLEKILCGLALSVLESYQSSTPEVSNYPHPSSYFSVTRYGLGLVPAICALLGVLVTLSMKLPEPTLTPLTDPLLAS